MRVRDVIAAAVGIMMTADEDWTDDDCAAAIVAAIDAAGFAVMPKEPTEAMMSALNGYAQCAGYVEEGYRAMIAAAKEAGV